MFVRLLPLLCLLTACAVPLNSAPRSDDDDDAIDDDDDDDDVVNNDDDDAVNEGDDDDDDAVGDDDDDVVSGDPEVDCDDGLDDDGDGLTDCLDDDCAGVFHCTWPTNVELHTVVEFFAGALALEFGVGDCISEFEGILSDGGADLTCADCDLEYAGAVTYDLGDCPGEFVDQPPLMEIGFGFLSETSREVWTRDTDTGAWELVGETTLASDGSFQIINEEPVFYDVPVLGDTQVGDFRLTRTFRDQ